MRVERGISVLYSLIVSLATVSAARAEEAACEKAGDIESLQDVCAKLKGLSVKTQGGTVVNATNCDVLLPKQIFEKEPFVQYKKANEKKLYTILALDPDTESKNIYSMHMIRQNVKGTYLKAGEISGTKVIEFIGPNSPEGTSYHPFVFLIFEQKKEISDFRYDVKEWKKFNINAWIEKTSLCPPLTAVQFKTIHEL